MALVFSGDSEQQQQRPPLYWGTDVGGLDVKDKTGTVVPGLDASVLVAGTSRRIAINNGDISRTSSLFNYNLRCDYADPLYVNAVSVNDIPYEAYDLYVYVCGTRVGAVGVIRIRLGDKTRYIRGEAAPDTSADPWPYDEVNYTTDPGTGGTLLNSNPAALNVPLGTYVRFTKLSGSSLNFDVTAYTRSTGSGGAGEIYFGGFQIVEIASSKATVIIVK